ncbi:unnamed protein product [Leuciscus chuanchicus]
MSKRKYKLYLEPKSRVTFPCAKLKRRHLDVADGSGSHTADVETMSPSGDLQLDPDETANMALAFTGDHTYQGDRISPHLSTADVETMSPSGDLQLDPDETANMALALTSDQWVLISFVTKGSNIWNFILLPTAVKMKVKSDQVQAAQILSHLENLGLTVNWTKSSLLPSQTASFLRIELDSVSMTARLSTQRARHVRHLAASFWTGSLVPLKTFQRMLGCMASAAAVLQLGLLLMRPLQRWLNARVPHRAWASSGLRIRVTQSCVSALEPWIPVGSDNGSYLVPEGYLDRRLQPRLGRPLQGQAGLWPVVRPGKVPSHALRHFLPCLRGHHVLVRTDNMSVVAYVNRLGGIRSKNLNALAECLLVWAQHSLLSLTRRMCLVA